MMRLNSEGVDYDILQNISVCGNCRISLYVKKNSEKSDSIRKRIDELCSPRKIEFEGVDGKKCSFPKIRVLRKMGGKERKKYLAFDIDFVKNALKHYDKKLYEQYQFLTGGTLKLPWSIQQINRRVLVSDGVFAFQGAGIDVSNPKKPELTIDTLSKEEKFTMEDDSVFYYTAWEFKRLFEAGANNKCKQSGFIGVCVTKKKVLMIYNTSDRLTQMRSALEKDVSNIVLALLKKVMVLDYSTRVSAIILCYRDTMYSQLLDFDFKKSRDRMLMGINQEAYNNNCYLVPMLNRVGGDKKYMVDELFYRIALIIQPNIEKRMKIHIYKDSSPMVASYDTVLKPKTIDNDVALYGMNVVLNDLAKAKKILQAIENDNRKYRVVGSNPFLRKLATVAGGEFERAEHPLNIKKVYRLFVSKKDLYHTDFKPEYAD